MYFNCYRCPAAFVFNVWLTHPFETLSSPDLHNYVITKVFSFNLAPRALHHVVISRRNFGHDLI